MADTQNNNRLNGFGGDKFTIEVGNDIVLKVRALREAQKSASKYEQEQIAWEIMKLTRSLNDKTIDEMEIRAKNELAATENTPVGELKRTLDIYIKDICVLRNTMKLAREAQDLASKEAMYKIFAPQENMNKIIQNNPDLSCSSAPENGKSDARPELVAEQKKPEPVVEGEKQSTTVIKTPTKSKKPGEPKIPSSKTSAQSSSNKPSNSQSGTPGINVPVAPVVSSGVLIQTKPEIKLSQNHNTYLNRDEHRRAWETYKSQPLTPEQQTQAEIIQKNLLYIEFAKMYHQIASEANESKMGFGGLRTSKEAARKSLEELGKWIVHASNNPQDTRNKSGLLDQIRYIDNIANGVGALIGESRIKDVETAIEGKGTPDDKYVQIVDRLRGGYIDNGTTKAGDIMAPNIINTYASKNTDIKNIQDVLNNESLKKEIQSATSEKEVRGILTKAGISENMASDVASSWNDINKNLRSNRDKLLADYKLKNPKSTTAAAEVDALINEHIYGGTMEQFQRIAVKEAIKKVPELRTDKKVELFAQAEGIDTWSVRDSRKAAVTEGVVTLAMMAIPMGIGLAAGRLAASGTIRLGAAIAARTNAASRLGTIARGVAGIEKLEAGSRVYHLTGKGLPLIGESFTFTESFNVMNNLISKDSFENWNDGSLNMKENVKNLAFFGILNSVQKLYGATGLVIKKGAPVPVNVLKGSAQILTEATAITGTSAGTEVAFGEDFHPTWEEFFQAMLMASVSRIKLNRKLKQEGEFDQTAFQTELAADTQAHALKLKYPEFEFGVKKYKGQSNGDKWEVYRMKDGKIVEPVKPTPIPNTKPSVQSHSDTTDLGAKARIEAEHGIGRPSIDHGYGSELLPVLPIHETRSSEPTGSDGRISEIITHNMGGKGKTEVWKPIIETNLETIGMNTTPKFSQKISRDDIATILEQKRHTNGVGGINNGNIGGKIEITNGTVINLDIQRFDGVRKEYAEALKIEDVSQRSAKLAEIDTRLAERLILNSGKMIEVPNQMEAQKVIDGLGKTQGFRNKLEIIEGVDGTWYVGKKTLTETA